MKLFFRNYLGIPGLLVCCSVIAGFLYFNGKGCVIELENTTNRDVVYEIPSGKYGVPGHDIVILDDVQEFPCPFDIEVVDPETKDALDFSGMGCVANKEGKRLPFKHIKIRLDDQEGGGPFQYGTGLFRKMMGSQ